MKKKRAPNGSVPRYLDADFKSSYKKMKARSKDLTDALEMARGWIDENREDECTGEGQQAKWIVDTIDSLLGVKA